MPPLLSGITNENKMCLPSPPQQQLIHPIFNLLEIHRCLTYVEFKCLEGHPEPSRNRRVDAQRLLDHTASVLQLLQQLHARGFALRVQPDLLLWSKDIKHWLANRSFSEALAMWSVNECNSPKLKTPKLLYQFIIKMIHLMECS